MIKVKYIPTVSVSYASNGQSISANELGMRPMQERVYDRRGEQYLLIKSPPASGKSRALMFVALDKLHKQGLKQAIIVVPEKTIVASFNDEPLSQFGFWSDWLVEPKWNLCNAPGSDNGGKVKSVGAFLDGEDKVLICTHATFRFAVDQFGVEAFDDRLIAVDEFHHVSSNPDNKLGQYLGQLIARDLVHIVAMTGSYFRGDAEAVLAPQDESKFDTVVTSADAWEKRMAEGVAVLARKILGHLTNSLFTITSTARQRPAAAARRQTRYRSFAGSGVSRGQV